MQGGFMGPNFYVVQTDLILSPLNIDSNSFLFCITDFSSQRENSCFLFFRERSSIFSTCAIKMTHIIHEVAKVYIKRKV